LSKRVIREEEYQLGHTRRKPTLRDLFETYHLGPQIVPYLDFEATIHLQEIFPHLYSLCRQHILHDILPETHIIIHTRVGELEGENSDVLFPVIKRIPRHDRVRVFPQGCIVYETETCGGLMAGHFVPVSVSFSLQGQGYRWRLISDSRSLGTNPNNWHFRNHDTGFLWKESYAFSGCSSKYSDPQTERFPVTIFYRRSARDSRGIYRLHAFSIPVAYLVDRLSAEQNLSQDPRRFLFARERERLRRDEERIRLMRWYSRPN
jgi:hypothetical protein